MHPRDVDILLSRKWISFKQHHFYGTAELREADSLCSPDPRSIQMDHRHARHTRQSQCER